MSFLKGFRLFTFATVSLLAIVALGLAADFYTTLLSEGYQFFFGPVAIAAAVITIITLPAMVIVDLTMTSGAFTSWVVVELAVTFVLFGLWVVTFTRTINVYDDLGGCVDVRPFFFKSCSEIPAILGLAAVNSILLKVYGITLLWRAILAKMRGHNTVWTSSVRQGYWLGPAPSAADKEKQQQYAHPTVSQSWDKMQPPPQAMYLYTSQTGFQSQPHPQAPGPMASALVHPQVAGTATTDAFLQPTAPGTWSQPMAPGTWPQPIVPGTWPQQIATAKPKLPVVATQAATVTAIQPKLKPAGMLWGSRWGLNMLKLSPSAP